MTHVIQVLERMRLTLLQWLVHARVSPRQRRDAVRKIAIQLLVRP